MAEAVDDGRVYAAESKLSSHTEHGFSDQLIDPWCDLCYDDARKKIDVEGFCPECNSFICESCVNAHKKSPASKKHKILRDVRMPKSQADRPVKYQGCDKHAGNVNDHFCLDHSKMACSKCIKENHDQCNLNTISGLCGNIDSSEIQQLTDMITTMKQAVSSVQMSLQDNITDIEDQRKAMIKEAESFREKLIAFARNLCSDTIIKITAACRQKTKQIAEQVSTFNDVIHSIDETMSDIDKTVHATVGPNQFIRLQDNIENARQDKAEIETMSKLLNKVELSFSCSSELLGFLSSCKQLGTIKEVMSEVAALKRLPKIDFPKSAVLRTRSKTKTNQRKISKIHATKLKPLTAETAGDKDTCSKMGITGMSITREGHLLLADSDTDKVKILSPNNQVLSSLSLAGPLTDITVINDKTAAVSTKDGDIHILDISDPVAPSVQKSINLGNWIDGMTMCNNNLVVIYWSLPRCIKMIDLNGRELWSVSMNRKQQELFRVPRSVTTHFLDDNATIIVTDREMDTLTLIDACNGKFIRTIDVKGTSPMGLTTDDYGNVYVCYRSTRQICVWSADLTECRILLSGRDLQTDPVYTAYKNTTDELFVGYDTNALIDRFQLS